jgi:hypothetical protein
MKLLANVFWWTSQICLFAAIAMLFRGHNGPGYIVFAFIWAIVAVIFYFLHRIVFRFTKKSN